MTQLMMIVEIFVAQCQGIDALPEQIGQRMVTTGFTPGISQRPCNRAGQIHLLVDLGEQWNTGVAGDVTTAEISFNFMAFNRWKFDQSLVAFCHGGIVPEYLFRNYILRGLNDSVVLFGELSGLIWPTPVK
jgi:hypothetical protein